MFSVGHTVSKDKESMWPLIRPGDTPLIKKASSYKVDDIVSFLQKGKIITHRVVHTPQSKPYLITKGDNNLKSDGKVFKKDLLGKVEEVKRGKEKIKIRHTYLAQSSVYQKEIQKLNKTLRKESVPYVFLKGLPLHYLVNNSPPTRLFFDVDLLIERRKIKKVEKIMKKSGYKKLSTELFGKKVKKPKQISFIKRTKPFPTAVDLHFQPAIGFTKTEAFDKLFPFEPDALNKYFFEKKRETSVGNIKVSLLSDDALTIFLLLHFFHHNFKGIHRLQLINNLVRKRKVDWKEAQKMVDKFKLRNFIYLGILYLKLYFKTPIPQNFVRKNKPRFFVALFSSILLYIFSPFDENKRFTERVKRLVFLFFYSPISLSKKLKTLFNKRVLFILYPR